MSKPRLENVVVEIAPGLTMQLLNDSERYSTGSIVMRIGDTHIDVSQGDKELGSIGMGVGGILYVEVDNRTWRVNLQQLFHAASMADQKREDELAKSARQHDLAPME